MKLRFICLLLVVPALACTRETTTEKPQAPAVAAIPASYRIGAMSELPVPAAIRSAEPSLAVTRDGQVILSWLEKGEGKGHVFKFATLEGDRWTPPRTIAASERFFVNWADFPSVAASSSSNLFAHWLQMSGTGYAYDVNIGSSTDGGATWSQPVVPHRDGTKSEHGFVSLVADQNEVSVVWLDGRNFKENEKNSGPMTLRFGVVSADGKIRDEHLLDPAVCDCCQTSMAIAEKGPVIVYRDRTEAEIRDISIVRRVGGNWTTPKPVYADGWEIEGCPVNGPQIDAKGNDVVVAWFTAANGTPRVKLAFSSDGGEVFSPPVTVDGGNPVGRVDVLMLPDGSALVTWLEQTDSFAEVRSRRITREGKAEPAFKIATSTAARSSGFPRTALARNRVYFVWTEPGEESRIRMSSAPLEKVKHAL